MVSKWIIEMKWSKRFSEKKGAFKYRRSTKQLKLPVYYINTNILTFKILSKDKPVCFYDILCIPIRFLLPFDTFVKFIIFAYFWKRCLLVFFNLKMLLFVFLVITSLKVLVFEHVCWDMKKWSDKWLVTVFTANYLCHNMIRWTCM